MDEEKLNEEEFVEEVIEEIHSLLSKRQFTKVKELLTALNSADESFISQA